MKQGIASDEPEARRSTGQHTQPCVDCPFARTALPGWLGSLTAPQWIGVAHGEASAECHVFLGAGCAGLAIYRANVAKRLREPHAFRLPANRTSVFSSPAEFLGHHLGPWEAP